ncbi:radical SAM protein [bacterium]|nr:radical SAM protein [bacterium]
MDSSEYKYLFGPVPSRRLGRSLGIDLIPFKTCSFNCVYCQLGPTQNLTPERREWVPTSDVLEEFEAWLDAGGEADTITLAGSGEPTLHLGFGDILDDIRQQLKSRGLARKTSPCKPSVRICLLSNGSLLHLPEVSRGAAAADVVKLTFSAPDETIWRQVHRCTPGLHFDDMFESYLVFRNRFDGELWLEVMLLDGINASDEQVRRLADMAARIRPDRIQLNTVVRPPAVPYVKAVSKERMEALKGFFDPPAEVIGEYKGPALPELQLTRSDILALVARHPATTDEVAEFFGLHPNEVLKHMQALLEQNRLRATAQGGKTYYVPADSSQKAPR